MTPPNPSPKYILLFINSLLLRLACFTGLIGSDDLGYSRFAQHIADSSYAIEAHHYAIRFGLLLPVGLVYRLFGLAEWTTILLPLLASAGSVVVLALIASDLFGNRAGVVAGLLYATLPIQLRYATILVPETLAEFYVLLGVLAYVRARHGSRLLPGFVAGLCCGVGYLTKEPALFIGLVLVVDAASGRRWRTALGVCLGCASVLALEHAYYLAASGDLLFRPHAMALHEQSEMVLSVNRDLRYRLLKSYPRMLVLPNQDFGIHSIGCLALAACAPWFLGARRSMLLILWALIPGAYINFGSSNLSRFVALPVAPRYLEFIFPPVMILAGAVIDRALSAGRARTTFAYAATGLICTVGFLCGLSTAGRGYNTDDVAVLREIARKAAENRWETASIAESEEADRWARTLAILAPALQPAPEGRADVVIGPDATNSPFVSTLRRDLRNAEEATTPAAPPTLPDDRSREAGR
ncbi:ArnT family glycosyltransferase [Planctomyces sp. SH-PL62]|uniref:ArnT family glycosyltransferase n=1 Tax=Planctomyces sp. SH-PL62 TaxID=1636152 RepID=UPI00078D593F|nr:glycosyltransferase family 39 protein [Planctomyces sp. SH-PL62]AMV36892.1 hypothetical protein VT85_05640 [Planctomyces sp. SH-PL62]